MLRASFRTFNCGAVAWGLRSSTERLLQVASQPSSPLTTSQRAGQPAAAARRPTARRSLFSSSADGGGGEASSSSGSDPAPPPAMGKGKKSVYAVAAGRQPGLYHSWGECFQQINGFSRAKFKGFSSVAEAQSYLQQHGVDAGAAPAYAWQPPPAYDWHPPPPQQQQWFGPPAGPAWDPAPGGYAAGGYAAEEYAGQTYEPVPAAAAYVPPAPAPRRRYAPYDERPANRRHAAAAAAAADLEDEEEEWGPAARGQGAAAPPAAAVGTLRLEFDGASKRNPGPAGFGAVLYDDASGREVARLCHYMGDHCTNNQAEYAGLIAGLAAALELGCRRIRVQGDSTLIVKQVLGQWRVKNEGLQPFWAAATGLSARFAAFEARQVPRDQNKVADALSNKAIDDYRSGANRRVWSLEAAMRAAGGAG